MKLHLSTFFKASFAFVGITLMAVSALAILSPVLRAPQAVSAFAETDCSLCPTVVDGQTGKGIENAVIVIPETGARVTTDADGKTAPIRIPYQAQQSALKHKDWCEVTLLAYAEGYAPYALFYVQVWENAAREGPVVMLFPGTQTLSLIEAPPAQWVDAVMKKYSP